MLKLNRLYLEFVMNKTGIEKLYKLLCLNNDSIKINKNLFKIMGFEQAVFYSYLVSDCLKCYKEQNYKYFGDDIFYFSPVDEIEHVLNLSAFKQRNILNQLEKKKLITVKYGHARARYIFINTDINFVEEFIFEKNKLKELEAKFIKFLNEQKDEENDSAYLIKYIQEKYSNLEQSKTKQYK